MGIFYVQLTHTATVTVNDLKTLADYVGAHYPTVSAMISSSASLTQVDVSFIPSAGNGLDYTGTYAALGTGSAAVPDAAACWLIVWTISQRYRGGHPRTYIPGVQSTDVTNGSAMNATNLSTLHTNAEALRNGINALTSTNITAMQMGTVHYQRGNAWLSPPTFDPYTSCKVSPYLATQRRRIHS